MKLALLLTGLFLAGQAYADIVDRYLGEDIPHRFIDNDKGFFRKLFGGN